MAKTEGIDAGQLKGFMDRVERLGAEVRETIKRVGGTLPEDLPTPKRSITEIEREQLKKLDEADQLMLDE